jgi:hypothetical protein
MAKDFFKIDHATCFNMDGSMHAPKNKPGDSIGPAGENLKVVWAEFSTIH